MSASGTQATVRVLSAEEIAARAGGSTPFLQWPSRQTVFAERAMRLRQLAQGHPMGEFLRFAGRLAQAQQAALSTMPALALPDGDALARAAASGVAPIPATDWPRDPAWHSVLRSIAAGVRDALPAAGQPGIDRLLALDADALEQQADCLLTGVMEGLDLAAAPLVAAALQVLWTHLMLSVHEGPQADQAFARTDDEASCPCCGSRPVASVTRMAGGATGQRYLHCSLCSLQWHMVRIQCTHCLGSKGIAYLSLDAADEAEAGRDGSAERAAKASIQAETCDACGHYLKIMHTERDPMLEPVADDLASLTLDLLVSDAGRLRHGVNLWLLFGEPPPSERP